MLVQFVCNLCQGTVTVCIHYEVSLPQRINPFEIWVANPAVCFIPQTKIVTYLVHKSVVNLGAQSEHVCVLSDTLFTNSYRILCSSSTVFGLKMKLKYIHIYIYILFYIFAIN